MLIKKVLKLRTASWILADFTILQILLSSRSVFKELDSFSSKIKFTLILLIIAYLFVCLFMDLYSRNAGSNLTSEGKRKVNITIYIYVVMVIVFTITQIIFGWTL